MVILSMVSANEVKIDLVWDEEKQHALLTLTRSWDGDLLLSGEGDDFLTATLTPDQVRSIAVWWRGADPGGG